MRKEWSRNDIDILIDNNFKNEVIAVMRQGGMIKLVIGDLILNVISAYVPQVSLNDDVKRKILGRPRWCGYKHI
jgi:hypothetical protein